jgi:hypothetical protein
MRRTALLLALPLLAAGCGGDAEPHARTGAPAGLDGVYRTTTAAADLSPAADSTDTWGRWTLALAGRRFALTRANELGCGWAYGGLSVKGARMVLSVVDAGGSAGTATASPADIYVFRWSRYRDILKLVPIAGGTGRELAAKPWRQAAHAGSRARLSGRCSPPAAALRPTGVEDVRPTGATVGFGGDFVRTGPDTWRARGTSRELGPGRMTIEGRISFADFSRSRVTFTVRVAAGVLRGCAITTILRRPHRRYVWDGRSQITATSPRLRQYLALAGGIGGVTMTYARNRMHGGFGSFPGTSKRGERRADVVC